MINGGLPYVQASAYLKDERRPDMTDFIIIAVLVLIIGAAVVYIIKEKKNETTVFCFSNQLFFWLVYYT